MLSLDATIVLKLRFLRLLFWSDSNSHPVNPRTAEVVTVKTTLSRAMLHLRLPGLATVCLLLMPLVVAGNEFKRQICENLDTVYHENGCALLQCQFGQLVPIYGGCGTEIDGSCHGVGEVFMKGNLAYQCNRIQAGNETQFRNQVVWLRSCFEDGFRYVNRETLRLKRNRCEDYQCQNGVFVRIQKSCHRTFDGNCHLVGENFVKDGATYTCTTSEQDGVTKYKVKRLSPDPGVGQSCQFANSTYTHLRIFTRQSICGFLQCQNGVVKALTIECMLKEAPGRCYSPGQRQSLGEITYQCNLDPETATARFEVVDDSFHGCQLPQQSYHHLEIFQDGCNTVQCIDGVASIIQGGCRWSVDGQCYNVDFVWKHEGVMFKCTRTSDDLYQIIEMESQ